MLYPTSIDCPTAGSCTAVGSYQDTIGITHAMAENLTSGTWTSVTMLAPTDAPDYTFSDLNSVSCVSVGNCIAVGDYRISTVQTEGFYAVETAGVWARGVELPVPADAASNPAQTTFVSASCVVGGTTCQLLGEYITTTIPATIHSVVDTYVFGTGLTAAPQEIAQLSGREGIELTSISCSSPTNCVAVGSQAETFSSQATFVAENGGTWGTPTLLSNPNDPANPAELLTAVSCVSIGNCVAAGNWVDARGNVYAEAFTETGGVFGSAVDLGQPLLLGNPFVDDISCVSTVSTCTIVGALSDNMGHLHAATAQMTGSHWGQLAPAGIPAGAVSDHELLGVSCAPGVQCTAVGYYNLNTVTGGTDAMAATWSIGSSPGAVTGLHSTAVSPTAAQLAWTAPTSLGTGIDHFEITAKPIGGHAGRQGGDPGHVHGSVKAPARIDLPAQRRHRRLRRADLVARLGHRDAPGDRPDGSKDHPGRGAAHRTSSELVVAEVDGRRSGHGLLRQRELLGLGEARPLRRLVASGNGRRSARGRDVRRACHRHQPGRDEPALRCGRSGIHWRSAPAFGGRSTSIRELLVPAARLS